jgi:lipid-binding SYLF domain-containing protein
VAQDVHCHQRPVRRTALSADEEEYTMLKSILVFGMTATLAYGWKDSGPEKRLKDAAEVLDEVMKVPEKAIPQALLDKAQCVIIVPGMIKAALGIGGEYGRGFASCRAGTSSWGPPVALKLIGGSFGLQLGAQATDIVMLVMNKRGFERLLKDKFTIGGEASAAAGPVGRSAAAETDALMHAEILSWSRSRGVFAGVSLNGTVVQIDKEENVKLYGKPLTSKEILEGTIPVPESARVLTTVLEKYAPLEAHRSHSAAKRSVRRASSRPAQ